MPDNHLRLKTSEKRQILVVDDEMVNRQLLGLLLSDDYTVIYAENGEKALEQIANNSETLSLVLLDLLEDGDGQILRRAQNDNAGTGRDTCSTV